MLETSSIGASQSIIKFIAFPDLWLIQHCTIALAKFLYTSLKGPYSPCHPSIKSIHTSPSTCRNTSLRHPSDSHILASTVSKANLRLEPPLSTSAESSCARDSPPNSPHTREEHRIALKRVQWQIRYSRKLEGTEVIQKNIMLWSLWILGLWSSNSLISTTARKEFWKFQ